MGANFSAYKTFIAGETLTASDLNSSVSTILTNFTPAGMDDYSANVTEMRTTTDPYPAAAASLATSLQGELERIRYVIAQITGETYWYIDPDTTIAAINTAVTTLQGYFTAGVANKANLPAAVAYEDEVNTFTAGPQTINGAAAANAGWTLSVGGTALGGMYASGAVLGTSATNIAIFAQTGKMIEFYNNGSSTLKAQLSTSGSWYTLDSMYAAGGYVQPGTGGPTIKTLYGRINGSTGAILHGTGFSAVRNSAGSYTITWSTAFSGIPAVIPSVKDSTITNITVDNSGTAASVTILTRAAGTPTDCNDLHFIAVGPP